MKNIKVFNQILDTRLLYGSADTKAQRSLAGYIIKTGNTTNPTFGAAFMMLREIEYCKQKNIIYNLLFCVDKDDQKRIVKIVETAIKGGLDQFSFSKREISYIITLF